MAANPSERFTSRRFQAMKQKIRKGLVCLIVGFVLMFLVRLTYGYLTPSERAVFSQQQPSVDAASGFGDALITSIGGRSGSLKNYATEKLKVQREGTAQ